MKELYPFQIKAHEAAINALNKGVDKQLNVMATGTGKTFCEVKLIEKLNFPQPTIWVAEREELINQSAVAFLRNKFDDEIANTVDKVGFVDYLRNGGTFPNDFKVGLIKADIMMPEGDICFASAQTLHRRVSQLNPTQFDIMVCDEAHGFMAKSYEAGVNFFSPKLLRGLTATPYRFDGLPLGNLFDQIVYEYNMREAINDGYLCEMDAIRIKTTTNLDSVHTLGGEFNQKELSNEINTLTRNFLVADSYIKYCNGRQGIFFGVDIQHCIDMEEAFRMKGINAKAISSDEERTGDRHADVRKYRDGKIDVLINVNLTTTGFDHPDTGCVGMSRPTKSKTLFVQGVGRGSRLKSKTFVSKFGQNCIILDFADVTNKHSLINAHELDKELPPEERCFISSEKRDKLISERLSRKITHTQLEDERIKLFEIPKVKISRSIRMREEATPAQLAAIAKWGYSITDTVYTKKMVSEIFGMQQISEAQKSYFKAKNYAVEGQKISVTQAQIMKAEIEAREKKQKLKKW